ncbi:hypothetical protein [Pseudomonas vancouverensis]|uniref:Uncharacterized protein n=1 Tax=Pseudomonas vancouverensis TaxID=95300 RepID=A0A1H2PAI5_PSEVA|nr:hypothetical protein [Pseudomonas vancouverensis]KAB0491875.1 hypothetical protein F7R09_25040 [Pseudomonas vancouverensis]TDB61996.1 hypothetical protein EIY72_14775 [Pseudomonas vancouverensis]SDV14727.1 hypothetical protein SAMN05216558_4586 [Pseudomonas vancouverensis]
MTKTAFDTWLINGNITIFFGSHPDSFKKDILASSLLSDLIAEKKSSNRLTSWPTYKNTVRNIGWTTNRQTSRRLEFESTSLLKITKQSVGSALLEDEQQTLANAIKQMALLQPESVELMTIIRKLESNAVKSDTPTTTVTSTAALLTIIRSNKTVITQQLAFTTNHALSVDLFDQPVLSSINDRQTNSWQLHSLLDERHYSQIRDDVLKKLGQNIESKLMHILAPTA